MRRIICVAGVIRCVALSVPRSAYAVFVVDNFLVTITQDGSNVVVTGSGAIDLSGLALDCSGCGVGSGVHPSLGSLSIGPAPGTETVDIYSPISGPSSFGSGSFTYASTGSGDEVGLVGSQGGSI
jgi:hypothetical protein